MSSLLSGAPQRGSANGRRRRRFVINCCCRLLPLERRRLLLLRLAIVPPPALLGRHVVGDDALELPERAVPQHAPAGHVVVGERGERLDAEEEGHELQNTRTHISKSKTKFPGT